MADVNRRRKFGFRRGLPDLRDHTIDTDDVPARIEQAAPRPASVKEMLATVGALRAPAAAAAVDLRQWCSPIEDQGNLGSCTANAAVGLVEYFECRASGHHLDASRLFVYKTTRNLMHETGDSGAYLRDTMKALVLFGAPPEEFMPYDAGTFDLEPSAFCYAFAQNYQCIDYYRLDPSGTPKQELLTRIKMLLGSGLPAMFGFTVYDSYGQADESGKFPFPAPADQAVGGHAVDVVGYDDGMKIKNANSGAVETTGALLIRNSWGSGWGDHGYGWLPYEYVLKGLAVDFWSVLKSEWVDTNVFGTPSVPEGIVRPARRRRAAPAHEIRAHTR